MNEGDKHRAQFFFQQGELELKSLLALVATTGPSGFNPYNMHQTERASQYSNAKLVSRNDNDESEDDDANEQGRLGVGWPWDR